MIWFGPLVKVGERDLQAIFVGGWGCASVAWNVACGCCHRTPRYLQVPDKPNFTAPRRLEASITRLEEILDGSTASQSFIDKAPRGFFVTQIDQQCQK